MRPARANQNLTLRSELFHSLRVIIKDISYANLPPSLLPKASALIEDILLPSIIFQYYRSKETSFTRFLSKISWSFIRQYCRPLIPLIDGSLQTLLTDTKELNTNKLVLLGDLHESGMSKYLSNGWVVSKNVPDFLQFISHIRKVLPSSFVDCIPHSELRENIVYRKFIDHLNETDRPEDIKSLYVNYGSFMALLLFFRAIDMNRENVIIKIPQPIFFDLECLFCPQSANPYSIDHTGIINTDSPLDTSALTGGLNTIHSYLKPVLSGTDRSPRIRWKVPSKAKILNIPVLRGKKVNPSHYAKQLIDGFQYGVSTLLKLKEDIRHITHTNTPEMRIVLRATKDYRLILLLYSYPHVYSKYPDAKSFFFEHLKSKAQLFNTSFTNESLVSESETLSKGLIPKFYAQINQSTVYAPGDTPVAKLRTTPLRTWEKHIVKFATFSKNQIPTLQKSFTTASPVQSRPPSA
ncbi:MAG: DUF4135 domain-containing protein [Candidatus Dojkabacteria bacterium]|nr:DUF4135 domain-containing protein [Candidatus Dojkabacteria bacterium]